MEAEAGGAAAPTATYVISGTIKLSGTVLTPLPNTIVNLSGESSANIKTDASGNYSFTGLAKGAYTVRPSRTGYSFSPVEHGGIVITDSDVPNVLFVATLATDKVWDVIKWDIDALL